MDCTIYGNEYRTFQEIKMNNTLIFGIALSLVLAAGFPARAQADCGCLPKSSCALQCAIPNDMDKGTMKGPQGEADTSATSPQKHDMNNMGGASNDSGRNKTGASAGQL
jgi:hypothetical protein